MRWRAIEKCAWRPGWTTTCRSPSGRRPWPRRSWERRSRSRVPDDPGWATDRISAPGGHVLIADDSRVNRAMMSKLLRSLGHDVDEAPDGNAALARLRDASAPPIDLVLLDLVMPELDGFATLAEMKRDPALAT